MDDTLTQTDMPVERILVVDDEEAIRDVISSHLSSANFQTHQASSGVEALALLDSGEEFDLILSDLLMPGMGGLDLLERAKERYPDLPVVMVTAVNDIQAALQALHNGAYDYLLKPFEREQLLAPVRRALENRRLKRENDTYRTNLEALVAARTQQLRAAMSDLERSNQQLQTTMADLERSNQQLQATMGDLERSNQQLRKTMSDLERSYDITLEALGGALDAKDAETWKHTRRVTAYTIAVAKQMCLPKEEISIIARGAFLHDIGKIAIPDRILAKPGKLTPEEVKIMKEHSYSGYKILSKIPFLTEAAEIVYAHQERYDGTGYPRGLKGNEIPLGARLFAIADTLDAVTSDRPYRAAQTLQAARTEIKSWSGRQFDPQIVAVFLAMPDDIWENLRKDIDEQTYGFSQHIALKASS